MYRIVVGLVVVSAMALGGTLFVHQLAAGDKKEAPEKKEAGGTKEKISDKDKRKISEGTKQIRLLSSALELAEYGRKAKAPEALLAAAKIIGTLNEETGKAVEVKGKEPLKESTADPKEESAKEAEELIVEALKIAKTFPKEERQALETLAKATRSAITEGTRPAAGGMKVFGPHFLTAGQEREYIVNLTGLGSTVMVQSLNGQDMDVFVTGDLTGNDYGSDEGTNIHARVDFSHLPLARVRIRVRNYGPNAGSYRVRIP